MGVCVDVHGLDAAPMPRNGDAIKPSSLEEKVFGESVWWVRLSHPGQLVGRLYSFNVWLVRRYRRGLVLLVLLPVGSCLVENVSRRRAGKGPTSDVEVVL